MHNKVRLIPTPSVCLLLIIAVGLAISSQSSAEILPDGFYGEAGGNTLLSTKPDNISHLLIRTYQDWLVTGIGVEYTDSSEQSRQDLSWGHWGKVHRIPVQSVRKLTLFHGEWGYGPAFITGIEVEMKFGTVVTYGGNDYHDSGKSQSTTITIPTDKKMLGCEVKHSDWKLYSIKPLLGDSVTYREPKVTHLTIGTTYNFSGNRELIDVGIWFTDVHGNIVQSKRALGVDEVIPGMTQHIIPLDEIEGGIQLTYGRVSERLGGWGEKRLTAIGIVRHGRSDVYGHTANYVGSTTLALPEDLSTIVDFHVKNSGSKLYDFKFIFASEEPNNIILRKAYVNQAVTNKESKVREARGKAVDHINELRRNEEYSYTARIMELNKKIDNLRAEVHSWRLSFIFWFVAIIKEQEMNTVIVARNALEKARDDALRKYDDKIAAWTQEQDLAKLHRHVSETNLYGYEALMREESLQLEELRESQAFYSKDQNAQEKAYREAMKKFAEESSFGGELEAFLEHLPLVGHEFGNIFEFARNPSKQNLAKMMLGLCGPLAESVGDVVIEMEDPSNPSGQMIREIIEDITSPGSSRERFNRLVNDISKDASILILNSVREHGLYQDKPGSVEIREVDYVNLADMKANLPKVDQEMVKQSALVHLDDERLDNIFSHAFGPDYDSISGHPREQVRSELRMVLEDPFYNDLRTARWGNRQIMGGMPAAFVYNDKECLILLNEDILKGDAEIDFFYEEELGHLLNWARGWFYDKKDLATLCEAGGDEGARFRDAFHMNQFDNHALALKGLPQHSGQKSHLMMFKDGTSEHLEAYPDIYTVNDHLKGGDKSKLSMLFRLSLAIPTEYSYIKDELSVDCVLVFGENRARGAPFVDSENAQEGDELVPTMFISLAIRDALKVSISGKTGGKGDFSPRLVRKHGFEIPLQMKKDATGLWETLWDEAQYFKTLGIAVEGDGDMTKAINAVSSLSKSTYGNAMKSLGGSVDVAIKGKASVQGNLKWNWRHDDEGWKAAIGMDVATNVVGAVAGAVGSAMSGVDPVVGSSIGSHLFEDLMADSLESAGAMGNPDIWGDVATWITMPVSIEAKFSPYKLGKSNKKPDIHPDRGDVYFTNGSNPSARVEYSRGHTLRSQRLDSKFRVGMRSLSSKMRTSDVGFVIRPKYEYDIAVKKLRDGTKENTFINNLGD